MSQMTVGERVVKCVLGEPIDRVPYGVGIGWSPWPLTMKRWREETGNPGLDLREELGFDLHWAIPRIRSGIWPPFEEVVLDETEEFVVARNERGIVARNRRDLDSMPDFLEYPVKTEEDWETLKRERLDPDEPTRAPAEWSDFRERIEKTGEAVRVGDYPHGVFGTPRDFLGAEELLISFYTRPEMVRDMMERLTTVWLAVWRKVADEFQIEHIHLWEDMSGKQGSLISPAMVEEFMMPQYDRVAAFAKANGIRIISVDTDGDVSELTPIMMRHGVNLLYPFEVQAGNDILEYRRRYPELGILGGLDKRALARGKEEIDRELAKAREMLKYGRYVPGFDHLIPPDVPWKNFKYAAERMKEICYGG